MAAHQAPLSLGFPRQEHWSGLPFPSPMQESEKWKWSRSVVSDPQWPHELQPSRLLRPLDFLGKSTGAGCHCLLRDLVLDVLNRKSSWDIKREPFRSWRSENEEQNRGQECNWDTSAIVESGVWLQSWPSSYLRSRSPYRLNFRPGNLTMYW